jgi:hypothetical protein
VISFTQIVAFPVGGRHCLREAWLLLAVSQPDVLRQLFDLVVEGGPDRRVEKSSWLGARPGQVHRPRVQLLQLVLDLGAIAAARISPASRS